MLSEQVQYQGKTGLFKLKFQNSISQNTGKYKLDKLLLRQSHIQLCMIAILWIIVLYRLLDCLDAYLVMHSY